MDERTSKDVEEVCRKNDRIIRMNIIFGKKILNVISGNAQQVVMEESIKKEIMGEFR